MLIVSDIEAARAELIGRGVDVSAVFHDEGGVFHHAETKGRVPGPDPQGRSYSTWASFSDPDGMDHWRSHARTGTARANRSRDRR